MNAEDRSKAKKRKPTLTKLYNNRPTWLDLEHRKLDEAVLMAYRWNTDLSGEEILEKLLALNFESVKTLSETNRNRRMKSTTNIEVTEEIKQKVIAFVKQNGFITNRQCRVLLGIGYEQAIALLNKLVESGELIREGKTSSVKYRLSIK